MTKRKRRLIILVKSIDGGTGTFVKSVIKIREVMDLELSVYILERPSFRKVFTKDFIFFHKSGFYPLNYNVSLKNISNVINEIVWFKLQIINFKPNIVLGVDFHSNLILGITKILFLFKYKTIMSTRINLLDTLKTKSTPFLNFILKKIVSLIYNFSDVLIATSEQLSNKLVKDFGLYNKPIVIYNGIDIIKNRALNLYKQKNPPIIISVGRLVEQKDLDLLVRAFSSIYLSIPKARLWIIGDGPEKQRLIDLTKKLNLNNSVKFLGWKNNINYYYKKARVFVLSSKREGFGWVITEAMMWGLPIISTDSFYGPSEILNKGKYGILIPVGNEKILTQKVFRLLTDESFYNFYAQKSKERIRFFTLEKMLNSYKEILINLTS